MSNYRSKLHSRIVVYQAGTTLENDYIKETGAGNILDLSSRHILSNTLFKENQERVRTATGTTETVNKNHVAEIPLINQEETALANLMQRIGCKVQFIAIGPEGSTHVRWSEPSDLSVIDRSNGPLQFAPKVLRLESNVFHPDITHSQNLIENIPFEGTTARARTERSIDGVSAEAGTNLLYGIDNVNGIIYEWDISGGFSGYSNPTRVTSYSGDLPFVGANGNYRDSSKLSFLDFDLTNIYEVDKETGDKTLVESLSFLAQGITVMPDGSYLIWNVDVGEMLWYDTARSSGSKIIQFWNISEFSQISGLSYSDDVASGTEWEVLVLDAGGTIRRLHLEKGSDVYNQIETWSISNTWDITTRPTWNFIGIIEEVTVDSEVRAKEIKRYDYTPALDSTRDIEEYVLRQRGVGERKGYEGTRFSPPNNNVKIGIGNSVSSFPTDDTITGIISYPVPFSTITLEGVGGWIEALDWNFEVLSTSPKVDNPTLDLSFLSEDTEIYALRLVIRTVNSSPRLVVNNAAHNKALGTRRGGIVEKCSERVGIPFWSGSYPSGGTLFKFNEGEGTEVFPTST